MKTLHGRDLWLGAGVSVSLGIPFLLISVAQDSMSTWTMAALRVSLAAITLSAVLCFRRDTTFRQMASLMRKRPMAMLVVAVTAAVIPNLLIGAAERHVPTGNMAIILATTPIWIAVGALLVRLEERLRMRQWGALITAVAGVTLTSAPSLGSSPWYWSCLPIGAALSYAVTGVGTRLWFNDVSALLVVTGEMLLASVVLLPLAWSDGGIRADAASWIAVAMAGIGCSGLGWLANTALMQRVGPTRASLVSYTALIVSIALGIIVLAEPLSLQIVIGVVILIGSVAVFLTPAKMRSTPFSEATHMLDLCILGFLAEAPMHPYELRKHVSALTGHIRRVSDGALLPALKRLEQAQLVEHRPEISEGGRARKVYSLTMPGRDELLRRLAEPSDLDISDRNRYFVLLAFLRQLPTPAARAVVLRRRLAFLESPARGFFVSTAPRTETMDTFRQGMIHMAAHTWKAEHEWITRTLDDLAIDAAAPAS
ncbi:MAG: transcriptional regulator, PadR-like family [Microbacterium sp.]|uniref:EamA family transporter n=1 Tax=Microbacterium sp. TaxID=51671 RepID=UPI00262C6867|nr:EamA family transporter [Microbacterium sp.]MDF2559565.1 transcriptional regulator, PadR-like family [Microbacterium sp.]